MQINVKRIASTLLFLGLPWLACMFFGMVFIPKITLRGEVQRVSCADLLADLPNRPQMVEVRGYRTDDELLDAAAEIVNDAGWSNWYVPLVPVEEPGEIAKGGFPAVVLLSRSEIDDFRQGTFRGMLKYPTCDVPLLIGSGDSALLEQRPDLVDPQRGWILLGWSSDAGFDPMTMGFPLVMFVGFCAFFGGMFVGPLNDPHKRLTVGIVGVSLVALGVGWLLYNPRLTPLLNGLLPGTALYCAVLGAALCIVFAFGVVGAKENARRVRINEGLTGAHDGDAPFEILDDGFIIRDRHGARRYRDRDVGGIIHVKRQQIGRDGGVSRYDRELTLRMRTDGKEEVVHRLKHAYRVGERDTLEPFAERILAGLVEHTWHNLGAGGRLSVGGWTVDRDRLTFESGGRFEAVALKELTAVEEQDACLHAWRRGVDRPFLEVSLFEENGEVLMGVLRRHLADYGVAVDNAFTGELGRMLFERRKTPMKAAGEAAALLLVIVLIAVFRGGLAPFGPGAMLVYAVGALAATLHVLHAAGGGILAYEGGLVVHRWFRPTTIRYEDLSGLTFRTKEHFQNGIYSGSVTDVELLADTAAGPQKVSFKHDFKHRDERLESIRNAAAGAIANRLWQELQEEGAVPWAPYVRITPTGLEYRGGRLNRGEQMCLPFESVTNIGLNEGRFQIFTADSSKPAITIDSGGENFFPGLELWQRAAEAARKGQREDTPSVATVSLRP